MTVRMRGESAGIGNDVDGHWEVEFATCPACERFIIQLVQSEAITGLPGYPTELGRVLVRPRASQRPPAAPDVPSDLGEIYNEACLVLGDSPKASAALGRRCLQQLLRTVGGVRGRDLANEIQEVLDSGSLPGYVANSLDAGRNFGNIAAHPIEDDAGSVIDVEVGEAEWVLDTLESLFDFYFVQPAHEQAKRDALNAKLEAAGKPPMKST